MRVDFEATNKDGSPRVFAGMHRPAMFEPHGYVQCSCGQVLQTREMLRDHWQSGHFDSPLYEVPDDFADLDGPDGPHGRPTV